MVPSFLCVFFLIFYFPQHPSLLFSCLNNWSPPPSLLTVCGREMHSVGPAGDPDALPDFFCGYAWSTLLVPSWGSFLRLNALSVTQSQVSCWHLPFVFSRARMAGCACFLPVWRSGWLSLSVYQLSAKVPHSPALCAHAGSQPPRVSMCEWWCVPSVGGAIRGDLQVRNPLRLVSRLPDGVQEVISQVLVPRMPSDPWVFSQPPPGSTPLYSTPRCSGRGQKDAGL